jgi:hypothetical protein
MCDFSGTANKAQLLSVINTLYNLPPALPHPLPLPSEPDTPHDPVSLIINQINTTVLTGNQQKTIVRAIEDLLEEEKYAGEVPALLELLSKQVDLTVRTALMIERINKDIVNPLNQE